MLILASVIWEEKGNLEPPCQVPGRWLGTSRWSLAAAFSVVRALGCVFCPCLLPRHMLVLAQNAKEKWIQGEICWLLSPWLGGGGILGQQGLFLP